MIPAHKLKIPDELCLIKTSGKGKGSKKMFICQICDNQVNRADKMKYHLFNEHYDDFIRCSDSVPKILAKNHSLQAVENKTSSNVEKDKPSPSVNKPSAIARIFAKDKKNQIFQCCISKVKLLRNLFLYHLVLHYLYKFHNLHLSGLYP